MCTTRDFVISIYGMMIAEVCDICEIWKKHFSDLYNCISDDGSKSHWHLV